MNHVLGQYEQTVSEPAGKYFRTVLKRFQKNPTKFQNAAGANDNKLRIF